MRRAAIVAVTLLLFNLPPGFAAPPQQSLVVVVPVDYEGQIPGAILVAESLRTFGGSLRESPVHLYAPSQLSDALAGHADELGRLRVMVRTVNVPDVAFRYPLGAKAFTAAEAERQTGEGHLVAIVAPNTIFLGEPAAFILPPAVKLGYSTVHHRNIGSPAAEPPDAFWSRLYTVLDVPEKTVFNNRTLADDVTVRFYFNAGSFVVRSEHGLLERWAKAFETLIADPEVARLCTEGPHNVFLHQAALAGAALASLARDETVELPPGYSYPLFFKRFHGGLKEFTKLDGVVTMRYEFRFADLPEGWRQQVSAPPGAIEWIADRMAPDAAARR